MLFSEYNQGLLYHSPMEEYCSCSIALSLVHPREMRPRDPRIHLPYTRKPCVLTALINVYFSAQLLAIRRGIRLPMPNTHRRGIQPRNLCNSAWDLKSHAKSHAKLNFAWDPKKGVGFGVGSVFWRGIWRGI